LLNLLTSLLVLAPLSPLLAEVLGGKYSELSGRILHGAVLVASWLGATLTPLLVGSSGAPSMARVALWAVLITIFLTGYAAWLDPQPGSPPSRRRRAAAVPWMVAVGLPAVALSMAAILLGIALAPALSLMLWLAALLGSTLGRRRRRIPLPFERSLSGLPPAAWKSDHLLRATLILTPLLALFALTAVLSSKSSLESGLSALQGLSAVQMGIHSLYLALGLLCISLIAAPSRRALALMSWEPLGAAVLGGLLSLLLPEPWSPSLAALTACIALTGCALGGAGVATLPLLAPHPLRAAGQLSLPLIAVLASASVVLPQGLLSCSHKNPLIEVILSHPGARAVEPNHGVHPSLFAAFPDQGLITRISFKGGTDRGLDLARLPPELLDPSLSDVRLKASALSSLGEDEVLLLASTLEGDSNDSSGTSGALIAIDSLTSLPIDSAATTDRCDPAGLSWHPFHNLALIGCEDRGELALYEPTLHRFIAQQQIPSAPDLHTLIVDVLDGSLLIMPRHGPFLIRYDLTSSKTLGWRFIGSGNLDLSQDIDGTIYLPRRFSRRVLVLDGESLEPIRSLKGALGMHLARPVLGTDVLLAASQLTGSIYAIDMKGEQATRSLHLGGILHDLKISSDGSRAFTAGSCGVLAIDLQRWLDESTG
tara:strand:- start:1453 stop:3411 length:1959 start_codon:yes stop_codon:yes gene_type:complete